MPSVANSVRVLEIRPKGGTGVYLRKTWRAGRTVEIKKTYSARYGRKIPRGETVAESSEAQIKVNRDKAVAELRRILNANFAPGDWHAMFTYPQEVPPTPEQAKADREKFLRKLGRLYKSLGSELKRVTVTEYAHKRIHHHIVINDLPGGMKPVKALWKEYIAETYYTKEERARGEPLHLRFPWSVLDDSGQYGELAEYLIKETEHTHRQAHGAQKWRYSCSRNLVRPKPKVEVISAKQWKKEPPERRGYYIDKNASYDGMSAVTGLPVQETVYVEITREQRHIRMRC